MAHDPVAAWLADLASADPYKRGRAAAELRGKIDERALAPLLRALEDDATYFDDFPGWDEPVGWSYRPSSPPEVPIWKDAAAALASAGALGLDAFLGHLEAAGPERRAKLISRSAAFGDRMEPALQAWLGTPDAGAALAALSHLEDRRQFQARPAFESIAERFMHLEPLKRVPSLAERATTLQKKLSEQLWSHSRHRPSVEPAWLALNPEPWLLAQPVDLDRWNRLALWMCGPVSRAIPRLVDALLAAPEPERWKAVEERVRWHLHDFRLAALASPPLWTWLAQQFALRQQHLGGSNAQPMVALAAVLAGDAVAGQRVLVAAKAGFDSRASAEAQEAMVLHFTATPALRAPLVEALVQTLRWQRAMHSQLPQATLVRMGQLEPALVIDACAAMVAQATEPGPLQAILLALKAP